MKVASLFLVSAVFFALTACATITRGTKDVLQIKTKPEGATVETSNGFSCKSTPCALRMDRKSELVVKISKEGCESREVNVTHETAGAGAAGVAGNVIFGGLIGGGVDLVSGASQNLVPNPVEVTLDCK